MADEWGLQAIITPKDYDLDQQADHRFGSIDIKKEYDQALLFCYPHLFDQHHHPANTTTLQTVVTDELDQLYKPFYPVHPPPAAAADDDDDDIHPHFNVSDQEIQQQDIKIFTSNTSQLAPKLKKRKNQQKRVVVQVTAAGLSSDPWAWRKYGQKPIKGSIYPRSYYRCSSSKGCMARRQVEQSCNDSSIYILTYTSDHNHPQPTRRNSLAGINRNRFKATPKGQDTINSDSAGYKTVTKSKGSPIFHSPPTISASSIEDEFLQQTNIKEETCSLFNNKCDGDQLEHTMMSGINNDDYMVFSDDFFEGLEDLGGFKMESSSYYSSNKHFPHVFC
ncbi:hypothetical protein QVD17_04403 [Tagetes erecta]|uniref:WRKY domain-containing protein n=1 Tax=Tagetes erecta TaxID=13708 RepID=A0AAD8LD42_TARER|nr:hypothetical protein QVD17_04403 [Tagetes erecta]